jgi:hypothetical protein
MVIPPRRFRGATTQRRRALAAIAALGLLAVAVLPSNAQAIILVGSDLSGASTGVASACAPAPAPCTFLAAGVHQGNAHPAKSPTDGVVTGFNIKSAAPDTVTFRLAQVDQTIAANATGDGTGPTVRLPGAGSFFFPASLPIEVGDVVGFNSFSSSSFTQCFAPKAFALFYHPLLVDGAAPQPESANSVCELLVNAVVIPSNTFAIGGVRLNKSRGTATLSVPVPGPGTLTLSGKGVVKQRPARDARSSRTLAKSIGAAGTAKLLVKAKGKTRQKLNSRGKAKVKVAVTFVPIGGTANVEHRTVRLKKS